MSEHPWMKFYPRDWRGDQALRAVSIAARGLWMECLCIMHEAKPYGHLLLNGRPVEDDALARMTGVPVDEVSELLSELRQAGVLSMTSKGVVFSRRMTKDHGRAQKGKKAAQKRWGQQPEKPPQNDRPNGSPNRDPTTQKPEARDSVPNGTGPRPTLAERIWGEGLAYLIANGQPEKSARSQLGKWRKTFGDGGLMDLISHCQATGVSEPLAYIEAAAKKRVGPEDERREFLRQRYGGVEA